MAQVATVICSIALVVLGGPLSRIHLFVQLSLLVSIQCRDGMRQRIREATTHLRNPKSSKSFNIPSYYHLFTIFNETRTALSRFQLFSKSLSGNKAFDGESQERALLASVIQQADKADKGEKWVGLLNEYTVELEKSMQKGLLACHQPTATGRPISQDSPPLLHIDATRTQLSMEQFDFLENTRLLLTQKIAYWFTALQNPFCLKDRVKAYRHNIAPATPQ